MTYITDVSDRVSAHAVEVLSCYPDADSTSCQVLAHDYRRVYDAAFTELLEEHLDLDGPAIGDLLADAAATVWPTVAPSL